MTAIKSTKTCTKCKRTLPHSEFHGDTKGKHGLAWWCKECARESQRKWKHRKRKENDPEWQEREYRPEAAYRWNSPEHRCYYAAKHRCQCATAQGYERYGGRGIEFRFTSFEELLEDIGCRPSPEYSLDRKNNNGHYETGNVRWATRGEQMRNMSRNRMITYKGKTETAAYWSSLVGLHQQVITRRLGRGWSVADALSTPSQRKKRTHNKEAKQCAKH